jgi:predicted RNA binding protein YcfA (HicA-like mRNA interferase family)
LQKLPIVSGEKLVKLLLKLGYEIVRQRGGHVRLRKESEVGEHNITVPIHSEIAKDTLNDILSKVSIWNNIPKGKLLEMLKRM